MKKTKSLLEQAKEVKIFKHRKKVVIDSDRIELSLGWLKGEITTKQANEVLGYAVMSANVLYTIASNLKKAYNKGQLEIINKSNK